MLQLKHNGGAWVPGGHPFLDPRTGKKFDAMSADLDLQVRNVIHHRRANPTVYPESEPQYLSSGSVRQEIVDYICSQRPSVCEDTDMKARLEQAKAATPGLQPPPGKVCFKCGGAEFSAKLCATCGGQKINGWTCLKCGTENPR